MNISWDNIDKLEDHYITYLLYKESRTVSQISKIRNLSTSQVNDQLIKAKLEIKSMLNYGKKCRGLNDINMGYW